MLPWDLESQKPLLIRTPLILIFSFCLFFSGVLPAWSQTAQLSWDPNTDPDLGGYKIYYGTSSRNYSQSVDAGRAVNYEITGLLGGVIYYFAATAYNTAGQESAYSNEVTYMSGNSSPVAGPLATITVTPASSTIGTGYTQQYAAIGKDAQGLQLSDVAFIWSSSDPGTAAISNTGLASGLSAGSASISASSGGVVSHSSLLQVTAPSDQSTPPSTQVTPPTNQVSETSPPNVQAAVIEISPLSAVIAVDTSQQFVAIAKDAQGSQLNGVPVTWASSSSDTATINSAGMATALSVGTSQIFAMAASVRSNSVALTVTHPQQSYTTASGGGCGFVRMKGGRPPDARQIAANLLIFSVPLLFSVLSKRAKQWLNMRREDWVELFAVWNGLRVAAVAVGVFLFAVMTQEAMTFISSAI
ncbi:MAG TPA: Ig-like domain-containing protein [Nitrospiria bacterium]|nr:Ig-like domain-containing protein [Nitrospiria bacterium]